MGRKRKAFFAEDLKAIQDVLAGDRYIDDFMAEPLSPWQRKNRSEDEILAAIDFWDSFEKGTIFIGPRPPIDIATKEKIRKT